MAIILDGKKISIEILSKLKLRIAAEKLFPILAIISCGDDPASRLYIKLKKKKCLEIGIKAEIYEFSSRAREEEIIAKIEDLNHQVDGIIVQLPLPDYLNKNKIISAIDPSKDVDGLTEASLGDLFKSKETFAPATPKGIIHLLEAYNLPVKGREAVIINHSDIVGKPLAIMLVNRGATVTICHEYTEDLYHHTKRADILASGVGKPNFITGNMVKKNSVVIDVGISQIQGKVAGDIDFASVESKAAYLSPVPGGVGPMTVAILLENVVNRASKNL